MPSYKIDWSCGFSGNYERKEFICESEEEMWHAFADAICSAFNNVRAIIDGKVIKEDPQHGWVDNCPICAEARKWLGDWYEKHGTYSYKKRGGAS